MEPAPLSRLQCACCFSDEAQKLAQLLEDKGDDARLGDMKAALAELRSLYAKHVTQYWPNYARSLVELSKVQLMNPLEASQEPLRTTAYTGKDLLLYRQPPKPKGNRTRQAMERKKRKTVGKKKK